VRTVRVLAVDDQLVFRLALRRLIAATPGFEQVGEAASGEEALTLASDLRPDLGLVDVRMPEMDGFETARRLAEVDSKLVIVLISIEDAARLAPPFAERAVAAYARKRDLSTRMLRDLWARHAGGRSP
jgi:DNA-binding NarL/FixJ family response regulator